jgi:hypothetical protein
VVNTRKQENLKYVFSIRSEVSIFTRVFVILTCIVIVVFMSI